MATAINKALSIILPKGKQKAGGSAYTETYKPDSAASVLSLPSYRNHTQDLFTNRSNQDSRALMKDLAKYDSDVSAALHAYLTVADTEPRFFVYNAEGQLDAEGQTILTQILNSMTIRNDYSTGFLFSKSLRQIASDSRYMVLLRGGIAGELVFNKLLQPQEFRIVDTATLEWFETAPGVYKPQQRPPGASDPIKLDIPTFFVKNYRQNPTEIYPESMFVSSINTIAARQQVINDLYRIMQKTGYPRIEVSVVEEVLRKNAPPSVRGAGDGEMINWVNARLNEISGQVNTMRSDSIFVHTDALETKVMNEGGPGKSMDVTSIINVLNGQNQAALKVVATIIGRGESGVNTASVEARVFSLAADAINMPIADLFSDMLTLAIRMAGYEGYVTCKFDHAELRPDTELEPMRAVKQARLLENLSFGLITDDEYHIAMFGRPKPSEAPEMSGTLFYNQPSVGNAEKVSPNSDPLGKSIAPEGAGVARSDKNKPKKK